MPAVVSRIAVLFAFHLPGVAAACPSSWWELADLELVPPESVRRGLERPKGGGWRDDGRIQIEARSLVGDLGPWSTARGVVRDGCVTLTWPSWPEYYLRPNTPFEATICADGASGDRSCSRQILFVAPLPSEPPRDESGRLHVLVRRVSPGEVVGTPPVEPMPRAALRQRGVDWRLASWLGAALAFVMVAVALGWARFKRGVRAV